MREEMKFYSQINYSNNKIPKNKIIFKKILSHQAKAPFILKIIITMCYKINNPFIKYLMII
jgi:hypothetical protein